MQEIRIPDNQLNPMSLIVTHIPLKTLPAPVLQHRATGPSCHVACKTLEPEACVLLMLLILYFALDTAPHTRRRATPGPMAAWHERATRGRHRCRGNESPQTLSSQPMPV